MRVIDPDASSGLASGWRAHDDNPSSILAPLGLQAGGVKCRVAIPKSAAASLEALANFALDGDEASAAALAPEDMDLVRGDDCGEKP